MLRPAVVGSCAATPVVALVGGLLRGERGGLHAGLGAMTAVVFLTAGVLAIGPVIRNGGGLVVLAALLLHATLLLLLFGVLRRVDLVAGLDRRAFGVGCAVTTLVWQVLLTWAYAHARHVVFAPEEGSR